MPVGYGLVGLVMAGLIGAILSTIDSMVNSAATLITFDLYKRFARPDADDRELLWLGRVLIALLITLSAGLAVATFDPTAGGNFFLRVSSQAGHFTPGLVAAFALGIFWQRATAAGAFAAIVAAPFFSIGIVELYGAWLGPIPAVAAVFGLELNFLHRVLLTVLFAVAVLVIVSFRSTPTKANLEVTCTALGGLEGGGIEPATLQRVLRTIAALGLGWLLLGLIVANGLLPPSVAAWMAAATAWIPFLPSIRDGMASRRWWMTSDLPWAALLADQTSIPSALLYDGLSDVPFLLTSGTHRQASSRHQPISVMSTTRRSDTECSAAAPIRTACSPSSTLTTGAPPVRIASTKARCSKNVAP